MRNLFDYWEPVAARLKAGRKIGLFLDFDGTLAKLRSRPDDVWLDSGIRRTLAALAQSSRFRVTVISGRRQHDVASRIGLGSVRYLGLHGAEGRPGVEVSQGARNALSIARGLLNDLLTYCPGVWIEDKKDILAVHFRDTSEPVQARTEHFVRRVASRFTNSVRMSRGKKVWELIPHELEDKGAAVRHELRAMGWLAIPVYVGDDAGDEPAFEALYRGVTVKVGRVSKSHAQYRLANVQQVRMFLERLRSEVA